MTEADQTPCVLIVDDEPSIRQLIHRWITCTNSMVTHEASNGLEALEILCNIEVDLIITDISMPVLNGIEMLSLVRSDPKLKDKEVIVATTMADEATVAELITLGVSDYVLKPLRGDRVVARVELALSRIRAKKLQVVCVTDTGRARVLIADSDPNSRQFAARALENQFVVQVAKTRSETLVQALRFRPEYVLVSTRMAGPQLNFLAERINGITGGTAQVFAWADADQEIASLDQLAGRLDRSYVPETFVKSVLKLVGADVDSGLGSTSWVSSLDPEVPTAVRQVFGMMTGEEPAVVEEEPDPECNMFGQIGLTSVEGDFRLWVQSENRAAFATALSLSLFGGTEDDLDEEMINDSVQEILNVVAGRLKNSCIDRRLDVNTGLPTMTKERIPEPANVMHNKVFTFLWQEHRLRLTFYATAGS
ncbi:MAG: response regulator [Acidobacteria bacterium]|nr:response regulator [Acidobacteriota bacterium]